METPESAHRHRIVSMLAIVFCVLGLAEMVPSVRTAVQDKTGDLGRQWVVTQYVIRRVNPYPVALDALVAGYGVLAPRGPVHPRDAQISEIPKTGPNLQTDHALGPPDATYPPGSLMLLVPLGFLARDTVAWLWLFVNLSLVVLVSQELIALAGDKQVGWFFFLGLVAAWPAVSVCIEREQFSLLFLYFILSAHRMQRCRPMVAGLLYSLALVKPSLAIPFLALPFLDDITRIADKAKTLVTLAVSQLLLLGAMCWMIRSNPIALITGWLRVAAYYRGGGYTVVEIINRLRLDGTPADFALQISVVMVGVFLAYRAEESQKFPILAITACLWTYHWKYDYVVLLIPAALLAATRVSRRWIVDVAALAIVGIGLTLPVYQGTGLIARGMRMGVRLSLVALLVGAALKRDGTSIHTPTSSESPSAA
jgi:hypothetical protein